MWRHKVESKKHKAFINDFEIYCTFKLKLILWISQE